MKHRLSLAVTVFLLATGTDRVAATTRMAPDTVLRHPDPSQPLAARWEWAHTQAGRLNRRAYWIGYTVKRPTWLKLAVSDDIALLFGYTADASGKVVLSDVNVASVSLPMDFRGRMLFWLGKATDAQSLPIVQGLFATTTQPKLRGGLVSAIGIHASSDPVVLQDIATSDPSVDARRAALVTLAERAPTAETVRLLTSLAINAQPAIARAAVEALGETGNLGVPALIEIVRTHPNMNVRTTAVAALGKPGHTDSVVVFLDGLAHNTDDEDLAHAAVEALGAMHGAHALAIVARIARAEGNVDLRRTAIEAYTAAASSDSALALLKSILARDAPEDVYTTVLEQLEGMDDGAGIPTLRQAAGSHPNRAVRADALRRLTAP